MKKRDIYSALSERILLLDGAMGTMIQTYGLTESDFRGERFASWDHDLNGCNDILAVTRPDILAQIHRQYLMAGADIITTCSFNAHPISLVDYGLEEHTYEISRAAASVARKTTEEFNASNPNKPRFVAGSVGPTNRTASMSADVSNPASREVTFDQLYEGYLTQMRGLMDGGADIILVETIFDSLNAKAALYAIDTVGRERGCTIPTMASGTLADASGRTLAGQTVEAFYNSLSHAKLISVGFNCAFGAKQLQPYLERLSQIAGCAISAHPNAGLPNVMGGYDETPEMFADDVEEYLKKGVINIIGGCCGTTPQHILCLASIAAKYAPRTTPKFTPTTTLSGLEPLTIRPEANFINVGERSNVAGSAKFARLIREGNYEEALSIARAQVDAGAQIIDVCMDDGMIDAEEVMHHFLCLMASEPEIARVPLMIDSSKWDVLIKGLKVSQGKSIVNSISIKEGEQAFIDKAMQIHNLGAAAVVMLFDEQGQADSYERKIEVAERAYKLLTEAGFPAEDIIFDANVLAVATGIEEHDSYGKAFIEATRWIKTNLPYAKVSGGVSNLSFAFRGNNTVREAMHSVFLYHAIEAGMDMAIVNAQMLQIYDQIEPELLEIIEDVILCRKENASERLIEKAERIKSEASGNTGVKSEKSLAQWRALPLSERIGYAMLKGVTEYIEADSAEGYEQLGSPMRVIDELLMPAMEQVGKLFGEGKMFLPQVVKSARVMKSAVAVLTPHIEALRNASDGDDQSNSSSTGKVLIATVKGDVHDIGKNIVSVVMACNGYEINDLGVMVETKRIVDEAIASKADVICMSGLITPSLDEMIRVVEECESRGITTPIIIGGATTSPLHTAVKIAPHYSGVVIHAHNASDNPKILSQLLGEERNSYIDQVKEKQEGLRSDYERTLRQRQLIPIEEARLQKSVKLKSEVLKPLHEGRLVFPDFDIVDVQEMIDWSFFFSSWGLQGRYPEILSSDEYGTEAQKLFDDAQALLAKIKRDHSLTLQGVVALLPARSEGDDIIITDTKGREVKLAMLRNQTKGESSGSLSDLIAKEGDYIGCFATTAGVGLEELTKGFKEGGDDYSAMIAKLLADRLAEAFTEQLHRFVRREMWGYESSEELPTKDILRGKYQGLRVAFGYPSVPDHSLKREVFQLLAAEMTTQMKLSNESYMISPAESLCGLILSSGEYFSVGAISDEQLADYASRRGITIEEAKRLLPNNI
ncbi:MAG: methionine synthase [Rikenellaceae bacterium]